MYETCKAQRPTHNNGVCNLPKDHSGPHQVKTWGGEVVLEWPTLQVQDGSSALTGSELIKTAWGSVEVGHRDGRVWLTVMNLGVEVVADLDAIQAEDIAMALAPVAFHEVRADENNRAKDKAINAMLYLIRQDAVEETELHALVDEAWGWDKR